MQKTIKNKSVEEDLKLSVDPYLFLWNEWIDGELCSLGPEEIHVVNMYLNNDFNPGLFEPALNNYAGLLKPLVLKLRIDYPRFKEWVVFKFLCCLIRAAKVHGSGHFLTLPVEALKVPDELKINLKALNIINIKQLFDEYTDDELLEDMAYRNIVAFHQLNKKYRIDVVLNEVVKE